jgi:hypothetical protein
MIPSAEAHVSLVAKVGGRLITAEGSGGGRSRTHWIATVTGGELSCSAFTEIVEGNG